jgi:hypothetical protein
MIEAMAVIEATQFLHPRGLIVDSASLLAKEAISRLRSEPEIEISLVGINGTSSSYFNTILRTLLQAEGLDLAAVSRRVKFRFESKAQEHVFLRSWQSVSAEAAQD